MSHFKSIISNAFRSEKKLVDVAKIVKDEVSKKEEGRFICVIRPINEG